MITVVLSQGAVYSKGLGRGRLFRAQHGPVFVCICVRYHRSSIRGVDAAEQAADQQGRAKAKAASAL